MKRQVKIETSLISWSSLMYSWNAKKISAAERLSDIFKQFYFPYNFRFNAERDFQLSKYASVTNSVYY